MKKIKIAAAEYLNSLPLLYGLEQDERVELTHKYPSEAARGLMEGEYDVALIPVGAYAHDGRLKVLDQFCISSKGPVASVVLASYFPPSQWKTAIWDFASRSSAALAEFYLDTHKIGIVAKHRVKTENILDELEKRNENEVALLIGDTALRHAKKYPYVVDLGEFYQKTVGKPFVYAVWAGLPEVFTEEVRTILYQAAKRGLRNIDHIAKAWAQQHGMPYEECKQYLIKNICFSLSENAIQGANHFLTILHDNQKIPNLQLNVLGKSPKIKRNIDSILSDGSTGVRLSAEDGIRLFQEANLKDLGTAAHQRRLAMSHPQIVTYIIERNINYTNVCNVYCRFCAFYRRPGHKEGYVLSREELAEKTQVLVEAGGNQILLQGGVHPDLKIEWYEDLFSWFTKEFPHVRLHALSPDEISYIGKISQLSVYDVILRLKEAGMASLPGAGAEILVDKVRHRIARLKTRSEDWLNVMRQAHRVGLRSSSTMMFGVQETYNDRIQHLLKLRELQDETRGFTAFICWPYQNDGTLKLKQDPVTTEGYLKTQAISRLMLDNIPNIQSSWVTMGPKVGQQALYFGANDFGAVMFEENVVSSAGTTFRINAQQIEDAIRQAGFIPALRDPLYQPITKNLQVGII